VSVVNVMVAAALSFIVLLVGKVSLDLMSKELQGQTEQLPHRILRLAARRLPPALRAQYSEDWEAELDHILNRHDARPITRLLLGFRFATSLLRGARRLRADHTSQPQYSDAYIPQRAAGARRSRRPVVRAVGICLGGQCVQVTTSGARCRNRVLFPHTRCHMHRKSFRILNRPHPPTPRPLSNWTIAAGALVVLAVVTVVWFVRHYGGTQIQLDAIRTAGTLVVGTGGAIALLLAARRQRYTELTLGPHHP
jgi:hypothetical protein